MLASKKIKRLSLAACSCLALLAKAVLADDMPYKNAAELGISGGINVSSLQISYERAFSPSIHGRIEALVEYITSDNFSSEKKNGIDLGIRHYFFSKASFVGPYVGYFLEADEDQSTVTDLGSVSSPLYGGGFEIGYQWVLPQHVLVGLGGDCQYLVSAHAGDPHYSIYHYDPHGNVVLHAKFSVGYPF
jgi:hypothetical protein